MKIKAILVLFLFFSHIYYTEAQVRPIVYPLFSFSLDSNTACVSNIFDKNIPDDTRCIGLGEVLHGGKQLTQVKAKLVQYLVQKRGYRTFLFEYPNAPISLLNYYLSDGKLKSLDTLRIIAANALKGSVLTYDTSFIDLLSWFKCFNLRNPDNIISVHGVDIYDASETFADYFMYNFSQLLDSSTKNNIDRNWQRIPADSITRIILSWVSKNRNTVKSRLKNFYADFYYNEKNAIYDLKYSYLKVTSIYSASFYRDSLIARNVEELSLDRKSLFWAFNGHVSPYSNFSAGRILKKDYKDKYYTILTDFSRTAATSIKNISSSRILKKVFFPNTSTFAYKLSRKYGITKGVLFYNDIMNNRKVKPWVECIDIYGKARILGEYSFDALIVLDSITSVR